MTHDTPHPERVSPLLLVALALLSMLAPFATDKYLPVFPTMASELGVPVSVIQLTLTTFFLGVAAGQLVIGPISDRVGRKPPMLVGAILCLLSSAVAAMAPNAEVLLGARMVQGFTGAAGIVIARAIVADIYHGPVAAKMFSLLAMVGGIAPVVAPLIGGVLAIPVGWRGILWALTGVTGLMLLAVIFVVPETHFPHEHPADRRGLAMLKLLRRPGFVANALLVTFAFVVLMGYIASSPFVFQTIMGLGVLGSGVLFAVNSAGIFIGSTINMRLVEKHGQHRMMRIGLAGLVAGVLLLILHQVLGLPGLLIEVPLLLFTISVGFLFGNSVALALGHDAEARGAGSAMSGASQFLGGAVVAPLVGLAGPGSAVPLTIVTTAGMLVCLLCYRVSVRVGQVAR